MTDHAVTHEVVISDEEILETVRDLVRSYDPLKASRNDFEIFVMNGVVRLEGVVNNKRSHRVLLDGIPQIPGVMGVNDKHLFDDETLTMQVAELLPLGVRVRLEAGDVILVGTAPSDFSMDELVLDISEIPGVQDISNRVKG